MISSEVAARRDDSSGSVVGNVQVNPEVMFVNCMAISFGTKSTEPRSWYTRAAGVSRMYVGRARGLGWE